MKRIFKRYLAFMLVTVLSVQLLAGCGEESSSSNDHSSDVLITETKIDEEQIAENRIDEFKIDESYYDENFVKQNLICEDGIYEYVLDETTIGECYCFEITVGETSETEIEEQLPEEIADYDIDWPAVIAKFSVGTVIIVATGVVGYFCPSTYYVTASPVKVGEDAIVGGAMAAALEVGIQELKACGKLSDEGIKKYAIEGFADGYMWAAITSVLHITLKNINMPHSLKTESGEVVDIAVNGAVTDAAGNFVGNAYFGEEGIFLLKEASGVSAVTLFDLEGKQIVNSMVKQLAAITAGKLPANAVLQLGEGAAAQIVRTDADGVIYLSGGELVKNVTYRIGNAIYKTDSYGRIVETSFDQLELKDYGGKRKVIANTINEIGKGYELAGDQRGHIIGDRFNGNNTLANMVPMSSEANQIEYAEIEEIWAEAIESGSNVSGTITFSYSGESFRPDKFDVCYDIGKGIVEKIILN